MNSIQPKNAFNEEAAIWFSEHRDELPFSSALTWEAGENDIFPAQQEGGSIIDELPPFSEEIEPLLFETKTASDLEEEQRNYAGLVLDNYKKTASKADEYSTVSDDRQPVPDPPAEKGGWKKILKFFILAWIVVHAVSAGVYLYIKVQHQKIDSAEQSYNRCLTELETNNFSGAKESCDESA